MDPPEKFTPPTKPLADRREEEYEGTNPQRTPEVQRVSTLAPSVTPIAPTTSSSGDPKPNPITILPAILGEPSTSPPPAPFPTSTSDASPNPSMKSAMVRIKPIPSSSVRRGADMIMDLIFQEKHGAFTAYTNNLGQAELRFWEHKRVVEAETLALKERALLAEARWKEAEERVKLGEEKMAAMRKKYKNQRKERELFEKRKIKDWEAIVNDLKVKLEESEKGRLEADEKVLEAGEVELEVMNKMQEQEEVVGRIEDSCNELSVGILALEAGLQRTRDIIQGAKDKGEGREEEWVRKRERLQESSKMAEEAKVVFRGGLKEAEVCLENEKGKYKETEEK